MAALHPDATFQKDAKTLEAHIQVRKQHFVKESKGPSIYIGRTQARKYRHRRPSPEMQTVEYDRPLILKTSIHTPIFGSLLFMDPFGEEDRCQLEITGAHFLCRQMRRWNRTSQTPPPRPRQYATIPEGPDTSLLRN